ncbi:hypothetical protein OBBRIDRAFT_381076 [Obba rivulosa]|uniref:Zn(2)-C6 fungal-type domain-containing protein n=1 Tax=Obba rivulosa TaxID=1052685 RepID=A0A8E2AZ95_9APHY|nr:hypothetical protein OBBRIDRAFT_381076 [Obba rivulosa]
MLAHTGRGPNRIRQDPGVPLHEPNARPAISDHGGTHVTDTKRDFSELANNEYISGDAPGPIVEDISDYAMLDLPELSESEDSDMDDMASVASGSTAVDIDQEFGRRGSQILPMKMDIDSKATPTTGFRPHSTSQSVYTSGKGGCWTCRLRRKKCDEEREGNACKTCNRLGIFCLGWGSKRPEWMRDKENVAAYKASIKGRLTRAGLIRGQPRAAYMTASSSVLPSPQLPAMAGPGRMPGGAVDADARSDPNSRHNMALGTFYDSPMKGSLLQTHSHPTGPPTVYMSGSGNDAPPTFGEFIASTGYDAISQGKALARPMPSSTLPEDYISYYFEHVQKAQYSFAGNCLTNTLYSIAVSDIRGAVSNTMCALASLHSFRRRVAQGLDAQEHIHTNFYNQAIAQLNNVKSLVGHYSETDAVAAVHIVTFSCFSGLGNWAGALEVAYNWLVQTGIFEEENPKLILMNMSPTARFAAKATMWIDVLSSITFMRPPRFLPLYRRLWAGGAGHRANQQHQQAGTRMDMLTGCPDEVVLAIAEISALGHWKATEVGNECLSTRELIRRSDAIELRLGQPASSTQFTEMGQALLDEHVPASLGTAQVTEPMTELARRQSAEIYREATRLYLYTVVCGSSPAVPEIAACVATLSKLIRDLSPSDFDRAIIFPLFLLGCMTDQLTLQEDVKSRLARLQTDDLGNINYVLTLLESVWNDRKALTGGVSVDWQKYLRQRWNFVLL